MNVPAAGQFREDAAMRCVVIDDQQSASAELRARSGEMRSWCASHRLEYDIEMNRRTSAELAFSPHRSAHAFREPFANREPKSGATVSPRRGRIGLGERLEKSAHRIRGNPNPGIFHREV